MRRLLTSLVFLATLAPAALAHPADPGGGGAALADTVEVARYATLEQAVEATVTQEGKLVAGDAGAADDFGFAVSLDGDRALVGAYREDEGGPNAGAAYVFAFDGAQPPGQQWSQEAKLVADDAEEVSYFGGAVSLSGDRALVGAAGYDEIFGSGSPPSAAYVFAFDGAQPPGQQWSQEAKFAPKGASRVGDSVSLDGDRALVGASSGAGRGAYLYAFDGSAWGQEAVLLPEDGGTGLVFGQAVSLDGDRAVVGAPAFVGGAAYVFVSDGASWSQVAKVSAEPPAEPWGFGRSVSLSGERVLVGSYLNEVPPSFLSGAAYLFAFDGASWSQEAQLVPSDTAPYDLFGFSVALDGELALIGAPTYFKTPGDPNSGLEGSAYVFTLEGGSWVERLKLAPSDGAARDEFGHSVSLDGGRALVGARLDDDGGTSSGSAYVLDLGLGTPLAADAGPDQTVVAGQAVTLDGTGSTGDDPLGYAWTLTGAALSDAAAATPSFCAAAPGAYAATLVVSAGGTSSAPDAVTVTALSASEALDALVADVLATAELSRGQARLLVSDLKKAQRALARGLDPAPFLDAFRARVLDFEAGGVLTAAAAEGLVSPVDAVAGALASPCTEMAGTPWTASVTAEASFGLTAYPNPSAGRTTVAFTVEAAGAVRLSVHDALGREVAVLVDGALAEGRHEAVLDAGALPAGVYLVRLATSDGRRAIQRVTRL